MKGCFLFVHKLGQDNFLDQQLCSHEKVAVIFALQPFLFPKNFQSLFYTILGPYGIICDDVGWCSDFNKGIDGVDKFVKLLGDITEGMVTNNRVAPSHGSLIGSLLIVVDVGGITQAIYFFSGGRASDFTVTLSSFSTPQFSDSTPSFSASTPSITIIYLFWGGGSVDEVSM